MAFRKKIIRAAVPYKINKSSYLKRGSRIAQSGKEDNLFDQMFEIELNENYEDNYQFRNFERAEKEAKDRESFRLKQGRLRSSKSSSFLGRHTNDLANKTPTRNHGGFDSKMSFASINNLNDKDSQSPHRNRSSVDRNKKKHIGTKSGRIAYEPDLLQVPIARHGSGRQSP